MAGDTGRPEWATQMLVSLARIEACQANTASDVQEVKDHLRTLNGTVRSHGEKLAQHETFIGLTGLGGLGGILTGAIALLKMLLT